MTSRRTLLAAGLSAIAAPAFVSPARGADLDYRAALAQAFGAPVDPRAAHYHALTAGAVAQQQADVLLQGQGLKKGGVGERLVALAKDPRWLYPDDEAGRDRAVADMNAAVTALRPRLALAFGDLPIAQAQARRMSAADVAAGKGGYREIGSYYVDLRKIRERPMWTLPSVAFHEVIPGHLLQLPLQAAAAVPAERAKAGGAYFEAWAIYAEQLAADLGVYRGDPRGELGYLQWRLFRLGRVVVDTGLHALGWSRDQAIATMADLQGQSIAFITIDADVDRIAATPAKYAAEALGALSLRDWRPRERAQWPAFHRAVLADGPWPFAELEARVRGPR